MNRMTLQEIGQRPVAPGRDEFGPGLLPDLVTQLYVAIEAPQNIEFAFHAG
jgi:hypothetical protein